MNSALIWVISVNITDHHAYHHEQCQQSYHQRFGKLNGRKIENQPVSDRFEPPEESLTDEFSIDMGDIGMGTDTKEDGGVAGESREN